MEAEVASERYEQFIDQC